MIDILIDNIVIFGVQTVLTLVLWTIPCILSKYREKRGLPEESWSRGFILPKLCAFAKDAFGEFDCYTATVVSSLLSFVALFPAVVCYYLFLIIRYIVHHVVHHFALSQEEKIKHSITKRKK